MTLQILNLSYAREHRPLFADVTARCENGECLQVTGANGSGKSTLLRLLAGFIPAEPEAILWNQACIVKSRNAYQRQLHYVGHHSGTRAHLTVRENLRLNVALASRHDLSLTEACDITAITPRLDTLVAGLSAGQRQRLALTRLLLVRQPLWILDEPMTALDKSGRDLLQRMLKNHLASGGVAVIATHHALSNDVKTLELGAYHG